MIGCIRRRHGCIGYAWNSLAIIWHILFPRVCGWKKLGRTLASCGKKYFGCIMLIWSPSFQSTYFHPIICMMEVWGGSKNYYCCDLSWESMGRNFSILITIFPEKCMAHSRCKEATLQHWRIRKGFHIGRIFPHIASWWWMTLACGMSRKGVMEWQEIYH